MKTTLAPALVLLLANLIILPTTQASTQPNLDAEGEALETAPAATLTTAQIQPGPAKIAGRNVNIRAKATINSEVITQLQDGDEVFVEEVILRPDAKDKDPNRWAKIAYPAKAKAWVHSSYIDSATGKVTTRKLNVRSGPGENYTIIGSLRDGDTVKQVDTKGAWIAVQAPEGSTAFVAAKLLRQEGTTTETVAATEETVETSDTEGMETEVVESESVVVAGTETGEPETVTTESTETEVTEGATTVQDDSSMAVAMGLEQLESAEAEVEELPEEPLPPRIVSREGIVQGFTAPNAPSHYKLVSADNGKLINYLYTTSSLDLSRYIGLHVVVTGEEELDERWLTPVLTLKKIIVVDYANYGE